MQAGYLLGQAGLSQLSTSFMYMSGGRINDDSVTVEPPMRFRINPKSGMAKQTNISKTTMPDRRMNRFTP